MIASRRKRKLSVAINRTMYESTMLDSSLFFHQHVGTMDTSMMRLTRDSSQPNSLQDFLLTA
jgi:hypothetical protein